MRITIIVLSKTVLNKCYLQKQSIIQSKLHKWPNSKFTGENKEISAATDNSLGKIILVKRLLIYDFSKISNFVSAEFVVELQSREILLTNYKDYGSQQTLH